MTPAYPTAEYNGVTVSVVPDDQIPAFTALWQQSIGVAIDGVPEDRIGDLLTDEDGPVATLPDTRTIYVMASLQPDVKTVCVLIFGVLGQLGVKHFLSGETRPA